MVTEVIRKALLYGDRIPRKRPAVAREVIVIKMSNPGAKGSPVPPEFDNMNHALIVYWLALPTLNFPAENDIPRFARRRALLSSTKWQAPRARVVVHDCGFRRR